MALHKSAAYGGLRQLFRLEDAYLPAPCFLLCEAIASTGGGAIWAWLQLLTIRSEQTSGISVYVSFAPRRQDASTMRPDHASLIKLSLISEQAFAARLKKHHTLARSLHQSVCARTLLISIAMASEADLRQVSLPESYPSWRSACLTQL